MNVTEISPEVIHRAVDTECASAFEIKAEINAILKSAGIGSTVTYHTKKGVTIGKVTPSGIKLTKNKLF